MKDSAPSPTTTGLQARPGRGVGVLFQDISKANPAPSGYGAAVWLALVLAVAYYLLNSPPADFATDSALSALVWPTPAIGVALLWRRPVREWPLLLLAIGVAAFMVGQLDWLPWHIDLLFAVLGPLEVGLGAWVARRWVSATPELNGTGALLRFVLLLPVLIAGLHALLFASVLWWTLDAAWLPQAGRIYAAQALAFLTVLPALLPDEKPVAGRARQAGVAWVATLLCLALALLPQVPDEAIRALLALALGIGALNQPPVGVARQNVLIAVALVAMTLLGVGPYVALGQVDVWALQLDLAGLSLLSLGLAVALGERRQLAQRLEQTRRMEALGFLAGGIAHDFNNLLGTVGACAEMVADQLEDEWADAVDAALKAGDEAPSPRQAAACAPLRLLETEVQRGRDMTQQLLLAARQGDAQRAPVALDSLLNEVLQSAQALSPAHVRLARVDALPDHTLVQANRTQLQRALHNLVRNATQAAHSSVTLRAEIAAPGAPPDVAGFDAWVGTPLAVRHAWIEVRDDGPGIAAEHWPQLFDPFYSTRLASGGSGLGLAIVAGVASSHEGGIGMKTAAGQGTCFRLSIPLAEPPP